jgi:hypothetical protein
MSFPSEWTGEDSTIAGSNVRYEKGRDWTIHAYDRQEGVQAQPGEGPTLLVRVVTSETEAGKAELSSYFKMLSSLSTGQPTTSYDLVSNGTAQLSLGSPGPAGMVVVRSQSTDGGAPSASQSYYKLSQGRLYVIAYVRSMPNQVDVDQPLVQEIIGSVSIVD